MSEAVENPLLVSLVKTRRRKEVVRKALPPGRKTKPLPALQTERVAREPPPRAPVLPGAAKLLQIFWPGMFEGEHPRPVMAGIKEQLLTDMVTRALPLLRTEVETGLKALVRSELYLTGIKEGALRYDAQGVPVATVTKKEALNAQLKLISIVQKKVQAERSAR